MHGKQQVRRKETGDVTWHYPVDARELAESGEYEIVSAVNEAAPVAKEIRTTTGAPIRDDEETVTKEDRLKQLKAMPAGEVRAIAEAHDLEYTNKDEAVTAIVEKEFGE